MEGFAVAPKGNQTAQQLTMLVLYALTLLILGFVVWQNCQAF